MREQIRSYVGAGLEALSPSGARDLARSILQGANRDRIQSLAQDLMEWSARSRERVTELIQREVAKQLKAVGVATKDDVDALRKRVRDLEKAAASPVAPRSTAKRSSTKKPSAKKSSSKKATAKRSTTKRSSSASSPSS